MATIVLSPWLQSRIAGRHDMSNPLRRANVTISSPAGATGEIVGCAWPVGTSLPVSTVTAPGLGSLAGSALPSGSIVPWTRDGPGFGVPGRASDAGSEASSSLPSSGSSPDSSSASPDWDPHQSAPGRRQPCGSWPRFICVNHFRLFRMMDGRFYHSLWGRWRWKG